MDKTVNIKGPKSRQVQNKVLKTNVRDISGLLQKILLDYGLEESQVEEIQYRALFKEPEEKHSAFRLRGMGGSSDFAAFVFPTH